MSGHGYRPDRREMLALTGGAILVPAVIGEARAAAQPLAAAKPSGRGQSFDEGWLFYRGEGQGLEAATLDDSAWRKVDLPHDWSVEDIPGEQVPDQLGPFDKTSVGGTGMGFALGGEGWYRRHFRLDGAARHARVEVVFDGVYTDCDVWLNGSHLGAHNHGYAPFAFDLTPYLDRSGDNVLAVRVRNIGKTSRWYSGSGIYRSVQLDALPAGARIARWGVSAWTRKIEAGAAELEVTTRIEDADPALALVTRLRDADGRVVAQTSSSVAGEVKQTLSVRGPKLWSPDMPNLHSLEVELQRDGKAVDRLVQPFGIRIVAMDARTGLQINGQRVIVRGGCIHHDNGLLGSRAFVDADDRRVRLLRARGYNAIRSSHNPASQSLLDACDRHGMLVIDEAFDMWHEGKNPDDYHKHFAEDWERPLTAMVESARNHPCVILWSIGNEIPDRSSAIGIAWEWKLANAVRRLDPTRPVTAALNGLLGPLYKASAVSARAGHAGEVDNAAAIFLDVAGYNYRLDDIEADEAEHPGRIVFGSETFPRDAWDYRMLAERVPYLLGEFVWTAMDYLGEAGIGMAAQVPASDRMPFQMGAWPWVVAWCGDIDLIGDQKAPSRYRDVVWGLSKLEIAVQRPLRDGMKESISNWGWSDELPSWSWAGSEGKALAVRFYTPGDRVELWLNGAKVAETTLAATDKMRAEIKLAYVPGILEAVAFSGGQELARKRLETVGAPARLRLRPESLRVGRGRTSLAYVGIEVLDAQGRVLPDEKRMISLSLDGPAELAGFGSGNPLAVGSFQAMQAQCYRGRALAILRGQGRTGTVRITAQSEGLASASVSLKLS